MRLKRRGRCRFPLILPESRGTGARPATLASRSTESNASRLPPMFARKVAARMGPNPGIVSRTSALSCCRNNSVIWASTAAISASRVLICWASRTTRAEPVV